MTVVLVDANNVAMRAVHAMARSGLSDADGVATGPLLAFINTLSKHVKEERPRAVAVCWDGGRSQRRVQASPDYKAHRLNEGPAEDLKHGVFALAKEFCTLAGLHHVERPGIEADDLIAHYWRQRNRGEKTVILSSDKDFLQLVDTNVEQVRLSSAGTPTDRWNEERVAAEIGAWPELLPYAMALAGDVSDNVIGVPRVGMKTAIKIIDRNMVNDPDGQWWARTLADPKVAAHADRVRTNLTLVDLRQVHDEGLHLPALPSFSPTTPGSVMYPHLMSFLTKHQMKNVQSRFLDGSLWR